MILCLLKYSEIVDTIRQTQFFVFPRFILNNIEWVLNMYTLLFLSGKKLYKNTLLFLKTFISRILQ